MTLYAAIHHEIERIQNFRREKDIKGMGWVNEHISEWELADRATEKILEIIKSEKYEI